MSGSALPPDVRRSRGRRLPGFYVFAARLGCQGRAVRVLLNLTVVVLILK